MPKKQSYEASHSNTVFFISQFNDVLAIDRLTLISLRLLRNCISVLCRDFRIFLVLKYSRFVVVVVTVAETVADTVDIFVDFSAKFPHKVNGIHSAVSE